MSLIKEDKQRRCKICKTDISDLYKTCKYCVECGEPTVLHNCELCDAEFYTSKRNTKQRFCTQSCVSTYKNINERNQKLERFESLNIRTCATCGLNKPVEEFAIDEKRVGGRKLSCRSCRGIARRLKRYNITQEEFELLIEQQEGKCRICKQEPYGTLSIDHDHECCPGESSCGKCVRGLLCSECNWGLGSFRDDIDRLQAAIDYLKEEMR